MGLAIKNKLYATNVGCESGRIFLSQWKPILKDGKYCWPPDTPLGFDMYAPNLIDIKEEEGPVMVKVVPCEEETGLWLICYDDYFGGEQHLYNFKPRFKEGTNKFDYDYAEKLNIGDDIFGLHIDVKDDMVTGDGPIPVTLERLSIIKMRNKMLKKIFKFLRLFTIQVTCQKT